MPVFTCRDHPFDASDVMDAAWFGGLLQDAWAGLQHGLLGEMQSDIMPDSEALQAVSEEVRYRHDLITSEDTEVWLESHQLTLSDLTEFCYRQCWRSQIPEPAFADPTYVEASAELRELLRQDLLFSGAFDEMARQLAWRVAAEAAAPGSVLPTTAQLDAMHDRCCQRLQLDPSQLPAILQGLGRERAWWDGMLGREIRFADACAGCCTDEARARALEILRLPLTRFDCEAMDLESADALHEAVLCLEVDGLSLAELAAQERYRVERQAMLLEDLPESLQPQFLSAEPGRVLELRNDDDERFQVCVLRSKQAPALTDARVLARIDAELIAAHGDRLIAHYIEWPTRSPVVS